MGLQFAAEAGRNRKSLVNFLRLKFQAVLHYLNGLKVGTINCSSTEVTTISNIGWIGLPLQG